LLSKVAQSGSFSARYVPLEPSQRPFTIPAQIAELGVIYVKSIISIDQISHPSPTSDLSSSLLMSHSQQEGDAGPGLVGSVFGGGHLAIVPAEQASQRGRRQIAA
jgi:hypothetical protein